MVRMAKRKIIRIDEARCTGCGLCISACAEGAIELKNGKASVVRESYCDGLGACLAFCPENALIIEERYAEAFDEETARARQEPAWTAGTSELPCTAPVRLGPVRMAAKGPGEERARGTESGQLSNWPLQVRLANPQAPCFCGTSLLIAGDCTAFAYPYIQEDFIKGRVTLIGCPKLDEKGPFLERLTEIFKASEISDITVLHMTVPCCAQLSRLVAEAVRRSGKSIAQRRYAAGKDGSLTES